MHALPPIPTALAMALAAACEIAGCYTAWMWLRLGRSPWWLAAGVLLLVAFAVVLTQVEAAFAGRAYAAYGGVYVIASLAWAAIVEHRRPDLADMVGAGLCVMGASIILLGRRG